MIFQTELIDFLGMLAIFIVGTICVERLPAANQKPLVRDLLSGLLFGSMIVITLIDPISVVGDVTFNLQGGHAILAGVFSGPIGALVAGTVGALAQWYLVGDPFGVDGVFSFLCYGLVGILAGRLIHRMNWKVGPLHLMVLGVLGSVAVIPIYFLTLGLHEAILTLRESGLLLLAKNVVTCLLVGFVFLKSREWMNLQTLLDKEQENTLLMSKIADETTNGVVITNKLGLIEWVNAGFERISGYTLPEVLGRKPGEFLQRDDVDPEVQTIMRNAIADVQSFDVNVLNYSKSGVPYRLDISCQPFVGHDGETRFMAIETDATERVLSQELLEQAKERAETANLAKSNFLSTMSHEIRTPLNGVLGLSQLLKSSDLDDDQLKKVNAILSSGQTLLAIISDVLDMSKIESGELELESKPFSMSDLVSTITTPFEMLADDKGLDLVVTYNNKTDLVVKGDLVRLRQILWNLLSNAIKFTEQGSVHLTLDVVGDAKKLGEGISSTQDHTLYFSVVDTGTGITADRIDAIFDAFVQEDSSITRKHGGTGLGLAIVKQLAELMGGIIKIDSQPGQGTKFIGYIPLDSLSRDEAEAFSSRVITTGSRPEAALKVIVAEDNGVNAMIATAFLHQFGCEVQHVLNGRLAVEAAKEGWADLIFMDIHMPEMNGIDATKAIRELEIGKTIPIIGLTAEAFSDRHALFLEAGMVDVLTKPFTEQQLADILMANRPTEAKREG